MKSSYILQRMCLAGIMVLLLTGCSKADYEQEPSEQEENKIQIGMIFDNFVMERWQRDRDVFVSTAKEMGAEVNVQNANGSVEEQIELINYFIKKRVDVIVIVPIDSAPLLSAVSKAQEEGIKVISYDRLIIGAKPDLYISFDNEKVGRLMAEALAGKMEAGDGVLMINGSITDNNVKEVETGFKEVMRQKHIRIMGVYYADDWKPEYAASYIRQNSNLLENVKGIMCGNDNLAGQAISALAEQRLAGEIPVVGQDADLAACQRIVEGTQYMTVYKSIEKLAAGAAQAAVALAENTEFAYEYYETGEGDEIPYIKLEPVAVNADNMQDVIIDSGFQLKEDVYLYRPDLLE
ncbi:MAG: substrate-binding domain-containing protein [Firmicutes bacterium]|nr:substrate-binding domain-containing protein [Bacillota bacterium]